MHFIVWFGLGGMYETHSLYWALNFATLKRSQGCGTIKIEVVS